MVREGERKTEHNDHTLPQLTMSQEYAESEVRRNRCGPGVRSKPWVDNRGKVSKIEREIEKRSWSSLHLNTECGSEAKP